jgi:hypothetical protein
LSNRIFKVGRLRITSLTKRFDDYIKSRFDLGNIVFIKAGTHLSIFEQWVVRIPCATTNTLLIRSEQFFFPLLNLLKKFKQQQI